MRIVLGSSLLAGYPQGGGLWTGFLQFPLGLAALGHDVFWLELFWSTGDPTRDRRLIDVFFERFESYGLREQAALLAFDQPVQTLRAATVHGSGSARLNGIISSADLLWNFAGTIQQPLLSSFRRAVFLDGDPGHLQVSAQTWDLGIADHHAWLTVGRKINDDDCRVPKLGLNWRPFSPFLYLPLWTTASDPGVDAPFSSITEWTWEELWSDDRILSVSKRDAYLAYVDLPTRARRPFELAANIAPGDQTGDRELLTRHGWRLANPHEVAGSPQAYQTYIATSRAELSCPKPIHRQLRTGWFSDRSACYLASGRPVVAEDTGAADFLPVGRGLLCFRDMDEAVAAVNEIDAHYEQHCRAARDLAEAYLDSRFWLPAMIDASA